MPRTKPLIDPALLWQRIPPNLRPVLIALAALALGFLVGWLAWGELRVPLAAAALPVIWVMLPTRWAASALGAGYVGAVLRYIPEFAVQFFQATWIAVPSLGIYMLFAAIFYGLLWPSRRWPVPVRASFAALLVLSGILTPASLLVLGSPVIAWGYILPGMAWFGVGAAALLSAWVSLIMLHRLKRDGWPVLWAASLVAVLAVVGAFERSDEFPTIMGDVGAVNTAAGRTPEPFELEAMRRITQSGKIARGVSEPPDAIKGLVFPESWIGLYGDPLDFVLRTEIQDFTAGSGQFVTLGALVVDASGAPRNAVVILRPDGKRTVLHARQPAFFGMWNPFAKQHYPSDYASIPVGEVAPGMRAFFTFCYEEGSPFMYALARWRGEFDLMVSVVNLAGASNTGNVNQARHMQGVMLLFGQRWVRAVNRSLPK